MPTFTEPPQPAGKQLANFRIDAAVTETDGVSTVALSFAVTVLPAAGQARQLSGDLTSYLTAQQMTNFTNAALALYSKAKLELLI